jgi:electron transfer flavoprotein-quinone oxidoreductase
VWVLDDESFVGTHFRSDDYNKPPYNRYTIIRAQFDKWFSTKVREAGALLICETTVDSLLLDDAGRVVGVRCDRAGGDLFADVVVLADGVNSLLARKAGFHPEIPPGHVALAVKEMLFLPQETLESRFNIKEDEGVVIEMMGKITDGMMGTGFLYTNKDSIALGVGCMLSDLKTSPNRSTPYALLERMKKHPSIAPLLEGGEMKEYAAHLIPEGGYFAVPKVYGDGWVMVGDAGGFVNAVHREGSNLAMTTGRLAAETIIEAKTARKPMSAAVLKAYKDEVDASFVMKDLHKYRNVPQVFHANNQFFTAYPELVNRAAKTMLTVDGVDKRTKQKEIFASFRERRSLFGMMGDAFKLWRALR